MASAERESFGHSGLRTRCLHFAHEYRSFWLGDPARRLVFLSLLGCLWLAAFGTQWLRGEKEVSGGRRALGAQAETAWLAPVPVLRLASLGSQGLLADLLFIRAAQYFVEHLLTDSRLPWLDAYLESIWGLDARNRSTYRWGAQVIKFGQRIDRDVAQRASRFARQGLFYFPEDPWLHYEIAFNLHFHLQPRDEAEKAASRSLALSYLANAYALPGLGYDPNYLANQYARAGRIEDGAAAALATYEQATAEQRRELRRLLSEHDRGRIAAELAWLDRFHWRDWDYLTETLAGQIGPRRVPVPPGSARPEDWLPEPPTPAEIWDRVGTRDVVAPPGVLDPWTADQTGAVARNPTGAEEGR
jgi:hypothetical protein